MRGKITLALFLMFASSSFFGCLAPRTSGVMVEKGRLIIKDAKFASNIKIISDGREKTELGYLHAQVVLENMNRDDYRCQYRFEWLGKNGLVQKHAFTPWRPIVLHGRTIERIDAVSPIPDTEDFILKLRSM